MAAVMEEYTPSVYEELCEQGEKAIVADDWCADAQRAIVKGSDGMWIRLGPRPDGQKFMTLLCSIYINPCTSVMAIIFLFGLVIFCASTMPGEDCLKRVPNTIETCTGYNAEWCRDAITKCTWDGTACAHTPCSALSEADCRGGDGRCDWRTFTRSVTADGSQTTPASTSCVAVEKLAKSDCYIPGKEFSFLQSWVTSNFTWLYIATQDAWIVFAIVLFCGKYGNVKLGRDDEPPEFSDFSFFAMVFTCGVATGLFFYACSEPIYHYKPWQGPHRWSHAGVVDIDGVSTTVVKGSNVRAQEAMNMVWYHWGVHGWVCYAIVGILLAFLHFRKGLPMTIKSCFYPLIGMRCYGFIGDVLDALSMCATTMGVCTSLGLGVMQLNTGMERLNGGNHWMGLPYYNSYNSGEWWGDAESSLKDIWDAWPESLKGTWGIGEGAKVQNMLAKANQETLLIWLITGLATTSLMCGLKYGIKTLALICFALGCFLMAYVWVIDDTWFITNLFVQTLGYYLQYLPVLGAYCGAFEQMESGNADGIGENKAYMDWWTMFYWGWWIAWAPFVGVFLARIARGRTIRQFLVWTIVLPVLYNLLFMGILGGAALRMQLAAEKNGVGIPCKANGAYNEWQADGNYNLLTYRRNICTQVATDRYTGEPEYFCRTITNLDCSLRQNGADGALYDVLEQYSDLGNFLCIIAMIALLLYFVASSDSGSMVDDMISSNGLPEPPLAQRFFWAMTEGAAATVLLRTGIYTGTANGGLKALQAISIVVGLPYTFFICFMCLALWRALQYEMSDRQWKGNYYGTEVCDFGVTLYTAKEGEGKFNFGMGKFNARQFGMNALYVVCPPLGILPTTLKLAQKKKSGSAAAAYGLTVFASICFYLWLLLCFLDYIEVDDMPLERGAIVGNATDAGGSTLNYISTRYGYFHGWTNKQEAGAVVTGSHNFNYVAGEIPLGGAFAAPGERMSRALRIEAVGWFFYFLFACLLSMVRFDQRLFYRIPGSLIEDFLCAAFCYPTVIYQITERADDEPPKAEEKVNSL